MKKQLLLVMAIFLALFLTACGDDEEENAETAEQPTTAELEITDEELIDEDMLVVSVNETELFGNAFNNIYRQLKMMGQMNGQDVSDYDLLKDEVVGILIEQELIGQDAAEKGIVVDEATADEEIEQIIEQNGEEAITAMLETYELTEEEFRNQLVQDLVLIEYIENTIEVEVTEDELQEQFDLLKEQSEEVTDEDYEEYEQLLKQSLTEYKQSQELESIILELREEAEIEILI